MMRSSITVALITTMLAGCAETTATPRSPDETHQQQMLERRVRELEAVVVLQQKMLATPIAPAAPNATTQDAMTRLVEQLIAKNGALESELATVRATASNACPSTDASSRNTSTVQPTQSFAAEPQLRLLVEQLRTTPPGQNVQLSHAQQAALLRVLGPTFADEARRARFKTLDGDPVPASSLRQIRNSL